MNKMELKDLHSWLVNFANMRKIESAGVVNISSELFDVLQEKTAEAALVVAAAIAAAEDQ